MQAIKLKDLKRGEYFTKKPIEYPNEKQVLIKSNYLRDIKKYEAVHFDDINNCIAIKGDTIVYIDFIF